MALIVFTVSMFVSAALLFLVEPMLAKMALPMLGGTPAVWNTCLVFFQAVLLAGYLYAHATIKWLGRRTQIALHLCLVLTGFAVLPLHIPAGWEPPAQSSPVPWILGMLSVAVGLPFFLLSASTPVMQRWFAQSGHRAADDPYFLYAASNAGSLVGLLGYPLLLEPALGVALQSHFWSYGYALFVMLTLVCAVLVWRLRPGTFEEGAGTGAVEQQEAEGSLEKKDEDANARWRERLRWILLAFVPSSLMLGVTTELTTDVPAIPLFWVLPLALYLLSFVLVFAKRLLVSRTWLIQRLPFLILFSLFPTISRLRFPLAILLLVYLSTLFAVALFCHGELALSRPTISRLTEFYLLISVGGVLGGIFNALIAPLIFKTVLEFPLVLIVAALLRPPADAQPIAPEKIARVRRNDWLLPLALGLAMLAVIAIVSLAGFKPGARFMLLFVGYSMLWCMSFGRRPMRFALGLTVLLGIMLLKGSWSYGQTLDTERSFFGVLRVTNDTTGKFRYLIHGATLHGMQNLDTAKSREPLSYYSAAGPAGSVLRALHGKTFPGSSGEPRKAKWAVVGLGAGAMACYLEPGETLTYYEIDPQVKRIATDTRYFTFLSQCAPEAQIVLGDARLKLRDAVDGSYDLIVLDAFSGDSIPMHLMTREALALYERKLAPGGMLAFHVSNLYLDLAPTLGALAGDAGLVCLLKEDYAVTQAETDAGRLASRWMVMARSRGDLGALGNDAQWRPAPLRPGAKVWTDDYSSPLGIIKWY